jgi:WD40 repeat protein
MPGRSIPTQPVRGLAFSPDGHHLVSVGDDGITVLWDVGVRGGKSGVGRGGRVGDGRVGWVPTRLAEARRLWGNHRREEGW